MLGPRDLRPDPLLTAIALEYGTGGGFACEQIVPRRIVANREFKYAVWDLGKYTSDDTADLRAPGAPANQDTDAGLTWTTGMAYAHAKKQKITDEDIANTPNPAALERAKIQRMVWSIRRGKELALRTIAGNTTAYAHATPAIKWDAAGGTNVVIEANIDAAKEAFLLACGVDATHILLPPLVAKVFKRDPTVRALRKFTDERLLINGELPPVVFGLNVVVPGGVVNASAPGIAPALARIWNVANATLFYVNPAAATDPEAMTSVEEFGQAGFPSGGDYPVVTWRDADMSTKTQWYSVENVWDMEVVAACIYIINAVLT